MSTTIARTPAAATSSTATAALDSSRFVRDVHALVHDLCVPNARRYWLDFLASITTGYAALAAYLSADAFSVTGAAALVACSLATFRAVAFTHELTHRHGDGFKRFSVAWNLLCGVPLMIPSFMYGDHKSHHTNHVYGTWADPEYLVHGSSSRRGKVIFLLLPLVYPLLPVVRFLILTPLAAMSARIDRLVWTCGSSLYVMNESYRREYDAMATSRSRWVQELACSAWIWTVSILVVLQQVPLGLLGRVYLVSLLWIGINQVRTLAAHRYDNDPDAPMTYLDQLLDTNTFPSGAIVPNLWAPLGLRYHALHHVMPSMPYHAMGQAHRRLMQGLPPGSPYHQTVRPGLWSALVAAFRPRESRAPGEGRPGAMHQAGRPAFRR